MNDSFYDSASEDVAEEDDNEQVDPHPRKKKIFANEPLIFSLLGVGLVVLVILIAWLVLQRKSTTDINQIMILKSRINQFEDRLSKIEEIGEQLIGLETQVQKFNPLVDRFDRFETSMSLRLDALTRQLNSFQNKGVKIKAVDVVAPKTVSANDNSATIRYHIVQAGETLYKISRQYGFTVEELQRSNQLESDSTIYPGQKLVINLGKK